MNRSSIIYFIKRAAILSIAVYYISIACSCNKTNNAVTTPKGILYLHLHTNIDTNEAGVGDVARDSSGRYFSFTLADFYMSGIVLHKSDGSTYSVSGVYVKKFIDSEEYYVDSIPAGNYTSISFNVGIDAATNSTNPSSYPSSNILSMQTPSMWFGSTSQGYIFMNLQGMADTTTGDAGTIVNCPFSYQLGTSAMLETVNMPTHATYDVVANQVTFIHLICDYGKALRGINFKTQSTATPFSNAAVAQQIANNIPTMFRYEE